MPTTDSETTTSSTTIMPSTLTPPDTRTTTGISNTSFQNRSTTEAEPSSFPIGALVGVAAVLIALLVIGCVAILGCFLRNKNKHDREEVHQLQDVKMERNNTSYTGGTNTNSKVISNNNAQMRVLPGIPPSTTPVVMEMNKNSRKDLLRGESDNHIHTHDEECIDVYDEVREEESEYSTISECVKEKEGVLRVSDELEGEENPLLEDMYTEVNDTAVMRRPKKHSYSGPLLLSSPICREMESNPDYVSSENIIHTLTETGVEDEGDMIYDEIQNEQITPSLFMKGQHKQMKEEKDDENDDDDEELIYTPIYSFPTTPKHAGT